MNSTEIRTGLLRAARELRTEANYWQGTARTTLAGHSIQLAYQARRAESIEEPVVIASIEHARTVLIAYAAERGVRALEVMLRG